MQDRPLARRDGVISSAVEEDLVIYDTDTHSAHCLTPRAAAVWELCDGRHTPQQIADQLDLDNAIVNQALAELERSALLNDPAPPGIARRTALKRIAQAGAAIIAAPMITTLAIPSAAAAASATGPTGSGPPGGPPPGTCNSPGTSCVAVYASFDCSGDSIYDTCPNGCKCQLALCIPGGFQPNPGACG
jgi:hypothetical protein